MSSNITNSTIEEMEERIMTIKYIALATIFVTTFVASLLPLRLISSFRNTLDPDKRIRYYRVVSMLNCFAAGVFFGTAFLDLMPQVTKIMTKSGNTLFPIGEFTIAFGFFSILTIEQIIIDCNEKVSDRRSPTERLNSRATVNLERETLTIPAQPEVTSEAAAATSPEEHSRVSTNVDEKALMQSSFHSIFLLITLSLHSFFEGLTIGFQGEVDALMRICFAILAHKIPVAFSVGLNLVQSKLKLSTVIQFDLCFCLSSPIGVTFAIFIQQLVSSVKNSNLATGTLLGLATGMFIFIIFIEILPKEIKRGRTRLLNLLFLVIGFSAVSISIIFKV